MGVLEVQADCGGIYQTNKQPALAEMRQVSPPTSEEFKARLYLNSVYAYGTSEGAAIKTGIER